MHSYHATYLIQVKGQSKIQEMAFVLVAIMIFFAIVALIYFRFSISSLKSDVSIQQSDAALALIRKIATTPEFSLTSGTSNQCNNCIDLDKTIILKESPGYQGFWGLDYLAIAQVYPKKAGGECTKLNYPNCNITTIVNKTANLGIIQSAFVSICRYDEKQQPYIKCELGKIYAAGKNINQ